MKKCNGGIRRKLNLQDLQGLFRMGVFFSIKFAGDMIIYKLLIDIKALSCVSLFLYGIVFTKYYQNFKFGKRKKWY